MMLSRLSQLAAKSRPVLGRARPSRLLATGVSKQGGKGGAEGEDSSAFKAYSDTLNLPTTGFPMRPNAKEREPLLAKAFQDTYEKQWREREGRETYVLHDGPPYANGDLHCGHALNKILKDTVVKHQIMQGKRVSFIPGWDCHGLPIELKAVERMKARQGENAAAAEAGGSDFGGRLGFSAIDICNEAKVVVDEVIKSQRSEFERWGITADWSNPYLTLAPSVEAAEIETFLRMYDAGLLERSERPTLFSPATSTALAEAEIEYNNVHRSTSVYVGFPIVKASPRLESVVGSSGSDSVKLVIWTTTPWTLPANSAVAVNEDMSYAVVNHAGEKYVVATDCLERVIAELGWTDVNVMGNVSGRELLGTHYRRPQWDNGSGDSIWRGKPCAVIPGDHVEAGSGSGLVHTAPGHGAEDFEAAQSLIRSNGNGVVDLNEVELSMISPVNDFGSFTAEAGTRLAGMAVVDGARGRGGVETGISASRTSGVREVLRILEEQNLLLGRDVVTHSYPYDWRAKKPVITRTTMQWFADVGVLQHSAVKALEDVNMMPKVSTGRLSAMLASRQRWCISRQRPWGLPIPVFYNKEDPRAPPLITEETVKYVSSVFAEEGSTAWWQRDTADLLPPTMSAEEKAKYEKGRDTLDVWFDSGCTWNSVLRERGLPTPSDLVLEGSDQHRGWFQSSLLTSVASTSAVDEDGKREWGGAPYRAIYTHGFVLDGEGRKMSKSVGNVVSPQMVVNGTGDAAASGGGKKGKGVKGKGKGKGGGGGKWPAYGADVLRWWAVSVDSTRDVAMSREGMEKTFENVRRLRNTIRYLLGNLNDFHPADHLPGFVSAGDESIKLEFERQLDAYVAKRLFSTIHTSSSDLSSLLFPKYAASLTSFVSADLSSLYFEAIKDRLYADERDGKSRRSAQAVLYLTYDRLVRVLTPSLPHLCEDAFQHSPVYQRIPDLEGFLKSGSMGEAGTVMEYTWPSTSEWEVQRSQHNGVNDVDEDEAMRRVLNMRDSVKRVLEKSRNEGLVGSSTDADVTLQVDTNAAPLEKALSWFDGVPVLGSTTSGAVELPALAELSVTSSFDVSKADDREWEWKHATYVDANGNTVDNENDAAARLIVHQPKGGKCARCWRWLAPSSGALCQRCSDVLVQQ